MKFLILILLNCTLITTTASAQQSKVNGSMLAKEEYKIDLKKYHTNKTLAWFFGGSGIILFGVGVAQPFPKYYINNDPALGYPKRKGGALRVAGPILGAASIPFFVNSAKYKRKASIALKGENAVLLNHAHNYFQYPALSFKLQL